VGSVAKNEILRASPWVMYAQEQHGAQDDMKRSVSPGP